MAMNDSILAINPSVSEKEVNGRIALLRNPLEKGRITVLQMDKTAPSNQSFLWHDRKRRQDADVDRHCNLRFDCYHEKAFESETFTLRNSPCIGYEHF